MEINTGLFQKKILKRKEMFLLIQMISKKDGKKF